MASAKATIDHDEIRKWVETRGGHPAHVKRTGGRRGDPGVLRIDYPGFSGEESLEKIDWDQWFDWFDRDNLAFLYQSEKNSRFSKLVDRSTVTVASKRASSKKSSSKKASAKRPAAKKSSSKKSSSKKASAKKSSSSKKSAASRKSARR